MVWGWPMLLLLVLTGVYFTTRTRFVQLRRFGGMLRLTMGAFSRPQKHSSRRSIAFAAMTTALAATVGTGNIAGVARGHRSGRAGRGVLDVGVGLSRHGTKYRRSRPRRVPSPAGGRTGRFTAGRCTNLRSGQGLCPARAPLRPARSAGRLRHRQHGAGNTAAEAAAFSLTAFFPALPEAPLRLFVGLLLALAVALALMAARRASAGRRNGWCR